MIDTHCHLNFPELATDLDAVLTRAQMAGVQKFVIPGTTLETSRSASELAEQSVLTFAAAGVHPGHAEEYTAEQQSVFQELVATTSQLVAIGEVGLDYHYLEAEAELQKEHQQAVFREMIDLAKQYQLPLIIHTRDAFTDCYAILQQEAKHHPTVIHCFTGSAEEAKAWLELGYYLGINGILTYKNNQALRAVVADLPLERLLLETDAPYLAPEGYRKETGEPRFIRQVAEALADIKQLELETVALATTENAQRLFKLG